MGEAQTMQHCRLQQTPPSPSLEAYKGTQHWPETTSTAKSATHDPFKFDIISFSLPSSIMHELHFIMYHVTIDLILNYSCMNVTNEPLSLTQGRTKH